VKKILMLLLLSNSVHADDLEKYYRSIFYKHDFDGSEYVSIKTNDDDKPLNYSTKKIKNLETIIISKKEFERLMQEFKL
jgi:hypothetical protein